MLIPHAFAAIYDHGMTGSAIAEQRNKMIPGIEYRGSLLADAAPGSGLHKHY
jgi:hypothetical protein